MLKVFLVEDETIIREGLRDIIPWQQYGYTLVGDAGDGEQALPMIRELLPDVLITDIKMPFMDGLALAGIVSRELPNTKIIIISGYDDFEYARQAIRIGVEQYLLKPITKAMLIRTLNEVQEKVQAEREQENYLERFRNEMQEYEQFSRRRFFEQMVAGQLTVGEIYEKASSLGIAINAQCYNLVMYSVQPRQGGTQEQGTGIRTRDTISEIRENLTQFFLMYPEYLVFRWNLTTYAVLIKGSGAQIDTLTKRCAESVQMHIKPYENEVSWHLAAGNPTERLSGLAACFDEVSHIFSYRHLLGEQHILTRENTQLWTAGEDASKLKNIDMMKLEPSVIRGFLRNGQPEEIAGFVDEYVSSLYDAVSSQLFFQYLVLNVRFVTIAYVEELGHTQEEASEKLPDIQAVAQRPSKEGLKKYIADTLHCALSLREQETKSQSRSLIRQALEYIDKNYADENISLKEVAGYTNVSATYFSAVFSQEMQQTFVEYLTGKRMERAKELLKQGVKRSAEIAAEVGYKDPHYFSFVFRKTQGCTPRDYRTGGKKG